MALLPNLEEYKRHNTFDMKKKITNILLGKTVSNPKDFKVGHVYKMAVAERSYVAEPYYVIVLEIGKDFVITEVPKEHRLKIVKGNNWKYHIGRFTYIGNDQKSMDLLYNQKLVYKQPNVIGK